MSETFVPPTGYRRLEVPRNGLVAGDVFETVGDKQDGGAFPLVVWRAPEPLVLPTEVGTVIAIGGWRFVLVDLIHSTPTWFLLAAATQAALTSMERANFRAGAGYDAATVLAEAEQEQRADRPGYIVLSAPFDSETGRTWRRDVARQALEDLYREWTTSERNSYRDDYEYVREQWGVK